MTHFCGFAIAELMKLAKMVGVMDEADHTYSVQGTWRLHRLANNISFVACVINSPSTFAHYLDLSNFLLESGLSYFWSFIHLSSVGLFCE